MSWFSSNPPPQQPMLQAQQANPFPNSQLFQQPPQLPPGAIGLATTDMGLHGPAPDYVMPDGTVHYTDGHTTPGNGFNPYAPNNGGWNPNNSGFNPNAARDTGIAQRLGGTDQLNAGGPPATNGNPTDRNYVRQQIQAAMQQNGITPGGRGSGPGDVEYYTDQAMNTGGWTPDNAGYWTNRLAQDKAGAGAGGSGQGAGGFGNFGNSAMLAPFTQQAPSFTAPSGLDLANDPGYLARLRMGANAIENSAFAHGKGLTGGALKDLTQYAQDYASNEYGNVFNRALQGYGANLGAFDRNYDIFRNNQTDPYNKLFGLTGLGLNAAQSANNAGGLYGNQIGNNATSYNNIGDIFGSNVGSTQIGLGNAQAGSELLGGQNAGNLASTISGAAGDAYNRWYRRQPNFNGGYSI